AAPLIFAAKAIPRDLSAVSIEAFESGLGSVLDAYLADVNVQWRTKPSPITLVCQLQSYDGKFRRDDTVVIDPSKGTVNNAPAQITDSDVSYQFGDQFNR